MFFIIRNPLRFVKIPFHSFSSHSATFSSLLFVLVFYPGSRPLLYLLPFIYRIICAATYTSQIPTTNTVISSVQRLTLPRFLLPAPSCRPAVPLRSSSVPVPEYNAPFLSDSASRFPGSSFPESDPALPPAMHPSLRPSP